MSGISDSAKFNATSSYYYPSDANTAAGVISLNGLGGVLTVSSSDSSIAIAPAGPLINISTTGQAQAPSTVAATGAISTTSTVTATGLITGAALQANSMITGSFTGVLGVGGSVNILQVAAPCYVEVLVTANPKAGQGDSRYGYQCFVISPALNGSGNLFLGANFAGLPSSLFGVAINSANGAGGTPTAYGTPVAINLGSVGGGGAAQSFVGSFRVMALPNALTAYVGAISPQTINYVVP
jgi:hypothetical protein